MEESFSDNRERVHSPNPLRFRILAMNTTIAATIRDNRNKIILYKFVRLTGQIGCMIARPAKVEKQGYMSIDHLLPCNLKLRGFRSDGPYFDSLTVVEGGAAFGYLHGLLNTVCLNEEPCDRFLGFCKRGHPSPRSRPRQFYRYFPMRAYF
jgi:hypothetical protein